MIEGVMIKVGGEEKTLPPLNWKAAKRFYKKITGGDLNDPEKVIDLFPVLLHTALLRNYPELTQEELEEVITPGELLAAIPLLLQVSGFTQASSGEA